MRHISAPFAILYSQASEWNIPKNCDIPQFLFNLLNAYFIKIIK
jgi:hypothetical protein